MNYITLKGKYKDIRNGRIYHDVVCKEEDAKFFVKVEE